VVFYHLTAFCDIQNKQTHNTHTLSTESGDKRSAALNKHTHTTRQATQTQPLLLAADAPFDAALEAIPAEDWCRTWAAGRTIMLRSTSKRVKDVVDKMRLRTEFFLKKKTQFACLSLSA